MANPQFAENIDEIVDRIKSDIRNAIPGFQFLEDQIILALIIGMAGRIFDFHETARKTLADFPSTNLLASLKDLTKNLATPSKGFITASGTSIGLIPSGSLLQTVTGLEFSTDELTAIAENSLSVTSLTNVGTEALAVTASPHLLATGISSTISGGGNPVYQGTFDIIVTGKDTFKYEIGVSGQLSSFGTVTFTTASIPVTSTSFGEIQNISSGETLSFTSTLPGVDSDTFVQFAGLTGGTDIESQEDFDLRAQEAFTDPFSLMNVPEIMQEAKKVAGVTRVFVQEAFPDLGKVTVFFMRDNDIPTIPDANEVLAVKTQLLTIKAAFMRDVDLIVSAPIANSTNFTIINLSPDTPEMREAVTNNLSELFSTAGVGFPTTRTEYLCAIQDTLDSTGTKIKTFEVTVPLGDIIPAIGEINTLGIVNFA